MDEKTKLKQYIINSGLKQKWIAIKIGIAETDFSKIVNGKQVADFDQQKAIAEFFNEEVGDLF